VIILKFDEVIGKSAIPDVLADEMEGAMIPLQHVFHFGMYRHQRFADVDFSKFTYKQAKRAMDEAATLTCDDYGDEEYVNRDNLIVQIARITHFKLCSFSSHVTSTPKRRFI